MRRRLGIHQKRALLDIVEDTFYYMQGNRPILRRNLDKPSCWRIIAGKLNRMGPMRKEPNGWKKAWCCMKCKVREKHKKLQRNRANVEYNGNLFDPHLDRFTNEDWRVIKMCNIRPLEMTPAQLITLDDDDDIHFLDPEVIIKSPPTSDEEEDMSNVFAEPITSAFITIKQLTELTNNTIPKITFAHQTSKLNEPAARRLPTISLKTDICKFQTPSVSNISNQFEAKPSITQTIKCSEPPAKQPPSTPQSSTLPNNSGPILSDISKQLGTIVKSLQLHTNMQRSMLKEMQKNNQLQKNVIHLLTDIKTRLPPQ